MALDSTALITLPEFKRYIGAKANDTSKDELLEDCINAASDMIIKHCNRDFLAANYVEYVSGHGTSLLLLPQFPVNSVTEIKVVASDGSLENLFNGDDTISNTAFVEEAAITLRKGYCFPAGKRNIKVSFNAGYESIPPAVAKVCKEIAAMIYKESKDGEDRLGVRSESKGVGATTSKSFYLTSEELLSRLDSFRKVNVWSR